MLDKCDSRDRENYGMLSGWIFVAFFFPHASSLRDILFFFALSLSGRESSDGEFIGLDIGNDKLPSLIRDFRD